jgi:hypothetical protein
MLWLVFILAYVSTGYIVDNTDCNQDVTIRGLPYSLNRSGDKTPIRIHFELGSLEFEPHIHEYFVDTMMSSAKNYLSKALQVNAVEDRIYLGVSECAGMKVPEYYSFFGIEDADVIVFVTGGKQSVDEGSWGAPCVRENGNRDNMIAGRIWLNSEQIEQNTDEDNISMLIHQTIHVLGFHSKAFEFWKNEGGDDYTAPQPVAKAMIRGKSVYKLTTPNVVA